jgi:hypothetical protein
VSAACISRWLSFPLVRGITLRLCTTAMTVTPGTCMSGTWKLRAERLDMTDPEDEDMELPAPEKVKEYMFEAISAMGPRIFRPNQDAHISYGMQREEEASLRPLMIITTGAFIAGAATGAAIGAIWERRRHRWN